MKIALLFLVLALCGCSVHYGPRIPGFLPGYVDKRLGEFTYQVRIGEAWPKDWHDLEKFALYRAAEITKEKGFRYFEVINSSTTIKNYVINTPQTTTTSGTANFYGNTAHYNAVSTTTGGGASTISGGWYTLDFKLLRDATALDHKNVIDADVIISDLNYFIDGRR